MRCAALLHLTCRASVLESERHTRVQAQITALQQALLQVAQTSVAVDADSSRFPPHWLFAHRCVLSRLEVPRWLGCCSDPRCQLCRLFIDLASVDVNAAAAG